MPRRDDRQTIALHAGLRTVDSGELAAIRDISVTGCRLRTDHRAMVVGRRVVIRPGGIEPLTATVRWTRGGWTGVEFARPLHVAVVDHLCAIYPDESSRVPLEYAA